MSCNYIRIKLKLKLKRKLWRLFSCKICTACKYQFFSAYPNFSRVSASSSKDQQVNRRYWDNFSTFFFHFAIPLRVVWFGCRVVRAGFPTTKRTWISLGLLEDPRGALSCPASRGNGWPYKLKSSGGMPLHFFNTPFLTFFSPVTIREAIDSIYNVNIASFLQQTKKFESLRLLGTYG